MAHQNQLLSVISVVILGMLIMNSGWHFLELAIKSKLQLWGFCFGMNIIVIGMKVMSPYGTTNWLADSTGGVHIPIERLLRDP